MKTSAEKIAVMQAYADGKQIQLFICGKWEDWQSNVELTWDWGRYRYRIKPEEKKPTYRPYINTDEMIADFKDRFDYLAPPDEMPLIWVVSENSTSLITAFESKDVWLLGFNPVSMDLGQLFKKCTYLDGSPCGELVEESR